MAHKRFFYSDSGSDEKLLDLAEKNTTAALMYPWILANVDDWGRAEGNPKRVNASLFPSWGFTPAEIDQALVDMNQAKLIHLYEVEGKRYYAINPESFYKNQPYIHTTKRDIDGSKIPAPPNPPWSLPNSRGVSREIAEHRGASRPSVPSPSPSPTPSPTPTYEDEDKGDEVVPDPYIDLANYYQRLLAISPKLKEQEAIKQLLDEQVSVEYIKALLEFSFRECKNKTAMAAYAVSVWANNKANGASTLAEWQALQELDKAAKLVNEIRDRPTARPQPPAGTPNRSAANVGYYSQFARMEEEMLDREDTEK